MVPLTLLSVLITVLAGYMIWRNACVLVLLVDFNYVGGQLRWWPRTTCDGRGCLDDYRHLRNCLNCH